MRIGRRYAAQVETAFRYIRLRAVHRGRILTLQSLEVNAEREIVSVSADEKLYIFQVIGLL